MRSSAPNQMENFVELDVVTSSTVDEAVRSKPNSFINLFSFEKGPLICFARHDGLNHCQCVATDCACNLTGGMLVPCNSPTNTDDSTASSPLNEHHFFSALLPQAYSDSNNNVLDCTADDCCDKIPPKDLESNIDSDYFNEEDEVASHLSALMLDSDEFEKGNLGRLLRRDSFGLAEIRQKEQVEDQDDDTEPENEAIVESPTTSATADDRRPSNELFIDDNSSPSDNIFFSNEDVEVEQTTNKHAVYRSLSDSTVHHKRHREFKRRKSVHFADTSGYDLEIHIPISHVDDYTVPPRLMEALKKLRRRVDAKDEELQRHRGGFNTLLRHHSLVLNFQQPFLEPTFQGRLSRQNICLESVSILPNSLSFTGVIRVMNIAYEKKVTVRYSTDSWRTYVDIPACYVSSLYDFHQDQFSFHVVVSDEVMISGSVALAFRYRLPRSNREFWDNNYGQNYVIRCLEHRANHCDDTMMT